MSRKPDASKVFAIALTGTPPPARKGGGFFNFACHCERSAAIQL